jgi:hypothetical protein
VPDERRPERQVEIAVGVAVRRPRLGQADPAHAGDEQVDQGWVHRQRGEVGTETSRRSRGPGARAHAPGARAPRRSPGSAGPRARARPRRQKNGWRYCTHIALTAASTRGAGVAGQRRRLRSAATRAVARWFTAATSSSSRDPNWCRRLPRESPTRCWIRSVDAPTYPSSTSTSMAASRMRPWSRRPAPGARSPRPQRAGKCVSSHRIRSTMKSWRLVSLESSWRAGEGAFGRRVLAGRRVGLAAQHAQNSPADGALQAECRLAGDPPPGRATRRTPQPDEDDRRARRPHPRGGRHRDAGRDPGLRGARRADPLAACQPVPGRVPDRSGLPGPRCLAGHRPDHPLRDLRAYGRAFRALLPGAELVGLRGVGHVPTYDDPRLVADTILEVSTRRTPVRTSNYPPRGDAHKLPQT